MSKKIFHHTEPLPPYAWPGGYPIIYLCPNGDVLCAACATEAKHGGEEITGGVHWEGPSDWCEECGRELESAYGDPDADEQDK